LSARLVLWQRLRGEAPADADVDILLSEKAWKTFERLQRTDPNRARAVWGSLDKLYYQRFWPPDNPNSSLRIRPVGQDSDGKQVLKFRAEHDQVRGFFRFERSADADYLPQVLIDDFSVTHDEEVQVANAVLGRQVSEEELAAGASTLMRFPVQPDDRPAGPPSGRPGTRYRPRLKVSYEDVENAISWAYSTVNILPTADQIDSIASPAPILINGQAGTGKTSMLAIRAAFAVRHFRQSRIDARVLCTAYSRLVVDVLKSNVKDFMLYKLREAAGPEQDEVCQFSTFSSVLVAQLDDAQRAFYSHREKRVAFGRFNREFFQPRKTHGAIGSDVSAEFVWYAIRCFFKGYMEEDEPPSLEDFGSVARDGRIPRRLTRDLSPDAIRAANEVFRQYSGWLHDEGFFDDIDLARAIWKHVRSHPPHQYDEIYLDEAQDLTRVEFLVLKALLKPGTGDQAERARIVLAGDPQQTIHPTGFNWRGIKAFFWHGEELKQTDLKINHRTPQPIVDFANAIQRRRHHYGMEDLVEQEARTQAGLKPICYQIESPKDDSAMVELLRNPRPGTALVVWAEDDDEIIQLLRFDKHINRAARELLGDAVVDELLSGGVESRDLDTLMASVRLHSVSEIKGLEFERVVFYKVGSNPAFARFSTYTVADLPVGGEFDSRIPILYHLNRLYVAITRSTRHLFIIDEPGAVEAVWSRFEEVDQSRIHQLHGLQTDPALSSDEHLDWTETGKQYLERFREERVARWLVHALTCFERARDDAEARALLIETKAELKEQDALLAEAKAPSATSRGIWKEAGNLWDENPAFYLRAANCYVNAEAWPEVERVLGASARLSPIHEGWYLFARLQNNERSDEKASPREYLDFLGRTRDVPRNEEWVSFLSRRLLKLKDVGGLLKLHGEICWSGNRGELKHPTLLVEALGFLDYPSEVVGFIDRNELQRQLWKAYSEAMRKLARQAESRGNWSETGRLWRTMAQQSPDQPVNGDEYRLAGDAFARAAMGGGTQYWTDAASCYGEAGSTCTRHRMTAEAEAAIRVGAYLPGIMALASTVARDWISEGPLKATFSDLACCERIVGWAAQAPSASLANDWDALGATVDAYIFVGKRPEGKTWLRDLPARAGTHSSLVYRKLASLEEEDKETVRATLDYERAGEFEKAWSLGRKSAEGLTAIDLARLEGRFLAWRHEHQREPSRDDADRAITLLTEAGEAAEVREIEALRLSREKDLLAKVRLVMSKGAALEPFMSSTRLVTAAVPGDRTPEARAFLLVVLAQSQDLQSRSVDEIRGAVRGWLSGTEVQRLVREQLSLEQFGVAVEFSMDEGKAKEFFLAEAAQNVWAREGYRRTIRRMLRDTGQRSKTESEQQQYVETLERELAETETRWSTQAAAPVAGPSGSDLLLTRTTLEGEPISRLREKCREAGLPSIPGASKGVLVEVYLAYWVGLQKSEKRLDRAGTEDKELPQI
jgi:superfamily I DNA/RNA helicase